jgi:hypothetical protein
MWARAAFASASTFSTLSRTAGSGFAGLPSASATDFSSRRFAVSAWSAGQAAASCLSSAGVCSRGTIDCSSVSHE